MHIRRLSTRTPSFKWNVFISIPLTMFLKFLKTLLILFLSWKYFRGYVLAVVDPSETKLVFYYGPQFNDSMEYNLSDATSILSSPNFIDGETHMYLHGYKESQDSESIQVIVEAYFKRKKVNLITVDWSKAAGEDYTAAAFSNIDKLAPALAEVILNLYNAGVQRESFRMVAHSLGAQLSGATARQVMKKTNGEVKIYRLAVLDAAFPLFFPPFLKTVNKDDVEFLQAIHTDIGTYGQPFSIGHVDFWPNGGRQGQPGCPQGLIVPLSKEDLCSHQRSWRFWAESVATVNGIKFWSFPSSNYLQFQVDGPNNLKKRSIEMGIDCPIDARGNYYLKTNSQPPFAMGKDVY